MKLFDHSLHSIQEKSLEKVVRVKQKSLEKMAALQRKIDNILREWKAKEDKKPLVIKGCRHIGQSGQMTILPLYMAFLLDKP